MNVEECIPKDKYDIDAVTKADAAGYPAIEPILGELLVWMQDVNWPVAAEVERVLQTVGEPLSPHILKVLQGDDDIWKYGVLTRLAVHFDSPSRALILDECLRMVNSPTMGELAEEVHLAAMDILILDSHD